MTLIASHFPQARLAGVRLDAVNGVSPDDLLKSMLSASSLQHIITANANYIREAAREPEVRQAFEDAALVVPDGMPVVWAARIYGLPVARRITGHDLTDALARLSASGGPRLFLLGGAPGVGERAAANLESRHPGVQIAGTYSPPMCGYPVPAEEDRRMVDAVRSARADALLVALGCPKQDLWIASHRQELDVSVAIGVGCVFDVLAGEVSRAPRWLQSTGMEWVYRLYQEPRRLSTRYARDAAFVFPLFLRSAASRVGQRRGTTNSQ